MKYSEAIRLGSMLYPQGFGGLQDYTLSGQRAVCANGAAALALGMKWDELNGTPTPTRIRHIVGRKWAECPVCHIENETLEVIVCLNDQHEWTRERIADWLAASGHDFEIDLAKPECAPAAEPVAAGVAE